MFPRTVTAILGSMAGVLRVVGNWGPRRSLSDLCPVNPASFFSHQIAELLPSLPAGSLQPLLSYPLDAPRWVRLCMAVCM